MYTGTKQKRPKVEMPYLSICNHCYYQNILLSKRNKPKPIGRRSNSHLNNKVQTLTINTPRLALLNIRSMRMPAISNFTAISSNTAECLIPNLEKLKSEMKLHFNPSLLIHDVFLSD
jgi:hypothetical protein